MAIIKSFRIKSFKNINSIIEFENVSLSYGNRLILDNISFRVNQGQIYGMLGPNGVGKSTIFNLITGLIKPSSGNIKINGDKANDYPVHLSGGQQQRAAIARALAISPEILLFDEPTSSLDPELVDEVLSVMRGLAEQGKTMLVVTHEMEFARKVSNKVIFLHDGLIEEEGHPDTVFTNPQSKRCRNFLFNRRD